MTLATIHAVKGLEFPVVFMAGMEEGVFPHAKALRTAGSIEEEQRLAYVGMTRAMTKLYLSFARTRQLGTNAVECTPSRFLAAIPRGIVEKVSASIPARVTVVPAREQPVPAETEEGPTGESLVEQLDTAEERLEKDAPVSDEPRAEIETEFDRWLAEGQGSWNERETERAGEIEAWVLSELEGDNTDLAAEILADEEMEVSEGMEALVAEAQSELLDYEMALAEIVYEREEEGRARTTAATISKEPTCEDESEPQDYDALLKEYAEEIGEHEREKAREKGKKRTEVTFVVAQSQLIEPTYHYEPR